MIGRTQTPEIKSHTTTGVAQFIAVAIGAVVPVNRRTRLDLGVGGPRALPRDRGERERDYSGIQR